MTLVHNLCYIVHLSDINIVIVVDYKLHYISGVPRNFVLGGVQQIQLRTDDIEKGDLGAVAP